ncbi:hypothetical protein HQ576_07100 [bacterium]|nr:hypothetical protein [bacterium]
MKKLVLVVVAALCVAAPAVADVVHLKSGGQLEGQVTETPDGVVVKLPAGEVRVSRDAVARIERKPSVLDEFRKRAAALKADDVAGHFALAQWAGQQHMKPEAQVLLQRVILLDPNHAGARQALGHRLVDGQWMTEEQQMTARGLVKLDGQWMTPEAAGRLRALEAELALAREKRRAAEAELQRAHEELEAPIMEPPVDYNPYEKYYENRDADRWRSRYYYGNYYGDYNRNYYGSYYHAPYQYYRPYVPYRGGTYHHGPRRDYRPRR